MINFDKYTELLQWHNGVELFNYNIVVDWALEMVQRGVETENMLILASFSKPVDRIEIKPYVTGVLEELNLEEKIGEYSVLSNAYFHAQMIVGNYEVRKNLTALFILCLENNYSKYLMPFYLLHHSWWSLEEDGINYYYEGANISNIEEILRLESKLLIVKYIDKNKLKTREIESELKDNLELDNCKTSYWQIIKDRIKKK